MRTLAATAAGLLLLALNGCGASKNAGPITQSPPNWADYSRKQITVRGTAANSRVGPGVRLQDGNLLMLYSNVGWPVIVVGRLVDVTGELVPTDASGSIVYMLKAKSWELVKAPEPPPPPEPVIEPTPEPPVNKARKEKKK